MPQQFERPSFTRTLASTFLARVDATKSTELWRGQEGPAIVIGVNKDEVVSNLDNIVENPALLEIANGVVVTPSARQALEDLRNPPSSDMA